ncbi:uncharacterized protein LY89DRAFT_757174 [Mollisia scopiformis]|uniref:Uncharacterized protein n=1 Tax=Mollisia scopiformis TaxID=149040 RepID=A0A194WXG4_MOLSC|nr:uncharacterized protein LY89DRAFT_757174 [Mollisia scopiformis]KUJ12620.1 hypothetical protein LY89DRAFT_757174 [Mollisia scopiformis]
MFKTAAPARVPTDTVIPLHFFDDTPLWRAFILYSMFVFDDVLDSQKLRHSLEALALKDGWRKLGARLRSNAKGQLEYHVPVKFSAERQVLAYSHATHNINAADHPIAAHLPKPSPRPATVCDPDEFRSLFQRDGAPSKLDDYLKGDIPQLGLHIVSFKDKTLVCLYWPHTLMDAMGKSTLLEAWSLMLQGRADEIVTPQGTDIDPLADLGKNPTESHKLVNQRLSMFGLAQYGVSNILDFFHKQENRMVCVPGSFMAKIRKEAMAELEMAANSDQGTFLSEGDVLCAWWTRLAISQLPRTSKRTVVLNNAYSLRKPLSKDLLPSNGGPYISNAIGFLNVLLPVNEIFSKPLSYVALAIRNAINQLGTRAQVEAFASMWRESSSTKLPPFFGNSGMHMITFSNWSKARLFETDFSAAVITPGNGSGRKPGRPSYIQNNQFGLVLPNGFPIIGKDAEGNYWLSGYMNKGQWAKIEEQLAQERLV